MIDERWLQFEGRTKVLHLIHEEQTGWGRTGSLISWCGRIGDSTRLPDPQTATTHCKMCEKGRAKRR